MIRRIPLLAASGLLAATLPLGLAATVASAATHQPEAAAATSPQSGPTSEQADGRPGFALAGGHLYAAWTGTNSNHNLSISEVNGSNESIFGKNILADTAIGGTGPGLAAQQLNGSAQVFVAWAGTDAAHHIYIGRYLGTGTLGCHTGLSESTTSSPFLVNTGQDGTGTLYLVWTGMDAAHHLNVAQVNTSACTSNSGSATLSNKVTLTDTADAGAAAAPLNGHLWIYWPGTDSGRHIYAGAYTGGPTLTAHTQTSHLSADDLGAVYDPGVSGNVNLLFLTYRGTDGHVWFAYTNDGTDFVVNQRDGSNTTRFGVGALTDGDLVWDGFAGTDPAATLNINPIFA
jgi:hypothetical protein